METRVEANPGNGLTKSSSTILMLGIGLGFLAERLLWESGPFGLGFVIWVAIFGLAASWLAKSVDGAWSGTVITWSAIAFVAALTLLFRTTPVVIFTIWLILIVCAAMVLMQRKGLAFRDSSIVDFLLAGIRVPFQAAFAAFPVLARVDIRSSISSPRAWSITRGALLATPMLLLFALLFASADVTFSRYVIRVVDLFSPTVVQHIVVVGAFGWIATGLLAGIAERSAVAGKTNRTLLKMGSDDTAVFMGLMVALFLMFVFLQLNYLFGGRETIETTTGLTLADYARRGFFELVVVAGLTLAMLISIANTGCNQRVFRPLAAILVVCVLIILLSAAQRLNLYISEFGLTIDRLTAVAAMIWLAGGLLLFSATVLRGRIRDFAAGLTIMGVSAGFFLALANPAAVVASVNIDRAVNHNKPVDIHYLQSLGADAVPLLMQRFSQLPISVRCLASVQTLDRWYPNQTMPPPGFISWRAWNASQSAARAAVSTRAAEMLDLVKSCPPAQ